MGSITLYRQSNLMGTLKLKHFFPYILGLPVVGFIILKALGNGDFKVFLEAAEMVAAMKSPYHVWHFISEGNYALYFYSPLWALILVPFTLLPPFVPNFIWLLANTWFLYRIWLLLLAYVDARQFSARQLTWLLLITSLLSARYILYNFEMIQMTIFLLWGALESLLLFRNHKFLTGGALLAIIINIKILPVVLIPYLIYRKEFRGVLTTLLFSLLWLVLPGLFLGWSFNLLLLSEWWSVINPANSEHLLETDLGMHSLTALIPNLLVKTGGVLPYSRNILDIEPGTATLITNAARAGLVIGAMYFLKWPPFKDAVSRLSQLRELSYIFLMIPLIFPHQQKYAFLLALPAFFYITCFLLVNARKKMERITGTRYFVILGLFFLSFVLMTLTTDGLIGRRLNDITQHYKAITYGALMLIPILILCSPRNFFLASGPNK